MTFGFTSSNPTTGNICIDDTYDNLLYLGKYTPIASGWSYAQSAYASSLPYTHYVDVNCSERPMAFFKPPQVALSGSSGSSQGFNGSAFAIAGIWEISTGVWRIACVTGMANPSVPQLYVFVPIGAQGPSSETWGMRIWNDAGRLLFDSGWNILKHAMIPFEWSTTATGADGLLGLQPTWAINAFSSTCEIYLNTNTNDYWLLAKLFTFDTGNNDLVTEPILIFGPSSTISYTASNAATVAPTKLITAIDTSRYP